MTLVRVADLIGRDIDGIRADIRSRNADGSLMHEHTAAEGPRMVTLRKAEYRIEGKQGPTLTKLYGKDRLRWMYWTWEKSQSVIPFDCGYNGHCAEDEAHLSYYIMAEMPTEQAR
jgi:hypothetical protein